MFRDKCQVSELHTVPGAPSCHVSEARRTTRPWPARTVLLETSPSRAGTIHGTALVRLSSAKYSKYVLHHGVVRVAHCGPRTGKNAIVAPACSSCCCSATLSGGCSGTACTVPCGHAPYVPVVCVSVAVLWTHSTARRTVVQCPRARRAIAPPTAARSRERLVARHRNPPTVGRPHRRARRLPNPIQAPRQHPQQDPHGVCQPR